MENGVEETTMYDWDFSTGPAAFDATHDSRLFFENGKHPQHSFNEQNRNENRENIEHFDNNAHSIKTEDISSTFQSIHLADTLPITSPLRSNINSNLLTKQRTPQPANQETKDFNVVRAGKLYEAKQKLRMEEKERIEREQRKFKSKKAPNFSAIHAALDQKKQKDDYQITVPHTPLVVKHNKEFKARWQKRRELDEASRKPKVFTARPPDVLNQEPFVPQIEKKVITESAPFQLRSDERSKERRQFDEEIRAEAERKHREEEERRKQEDERIRRQVRKATVFKAQPNPFK